MKLHPMHARQVPESSIDPSHFQTGICMKWNDHKPPSSLSRRLIIFSMPFVVALTGCHATMSDQTDAHAGHHMTTNSFPLRFDEHNFQAFCFNTLTCSVIYHQHDFTRFSAHTPSGPPPTPDYKEHWPFASFIGINNFPPPAEVRWTSLDGAPHEANVDMRAIFKDQLVLYRVPEAEVPDGAFVGPVLDPSIFLEVNDRTVNVYMKAFIPTKTEQIPGNKYSYGRDDVILAWSHTY